MKNAKFSYCHDILFHSVFFMIHAFRLRYYWKAVSSPYLLLSNSRGEMNFLEPLWCYPAKHFKLKISLLE